MTRTLVLIAGASFVLAVACLSGAGALGWSEASHHHWGPGWNIHFGDDHDRHFIGHGSPSDAASGATITRELAWSGGDSLDIGLPAKVQFTQSSGPAKLVVTGPKDAVDHVVLSGSHLQFDNDEDFDGPLTVTMTAPNVRHFDISGAADLAIAGYAQDDIDVDVSGSGSVTAAGKAKNVKLDISGDGTVDLSGLASESAQAEISGAGKATIAPASAADLHISGEGEIDLKSHPTKLTSDVSGAGRIVEGGGDVAKAN
jgi:hypothetical protein